MHQVSTHCFGVVSLLPALWMEIQVMSVLPTKTMSLANDYERFAVDIIQTVINSGNYKPTDALVAKVGAMLANGPMITTWPRDVAEAAQRARDRAHAAATRLPRPLALPSLPRPAPLPSLPRGALSLPSLPRLPAPAPLPRP